VKVRRYQFHIRFIFELHGSPAPFKPERFAVRPTFRFLSLSRISVSAHGLGQSISQTSKSCSSGTYVARVTCPTTWSFGELMLRLRQAIKRKCSAA